MFVFRNVFIYLLTLTLFSPYAFSQPNDLTLWYDEPASEWVEALPVGNGSLGAMVFGGIEKDRIQFNEDTLWTGVPRDYINPKAKETLPKVRELLFEGNQSEAERVANDMMSLPLHQEAYQPFGDVWLEFPGHDNATNYRRSLDLERAINKTTYQVDGVTYTREVFSSFPDQTIVIRITSSKENAINCVISKTSPHKESMVKNEISGSDGLIILNGNVSDAELRKDLIKPSVLRFESRLLIQSKEGDIGIADKGISVKNASEIVIKLCAATSYKNYRDIGNDPLEISMDTLSKVEEQNYATLQKRHITDYQSIFNRLSLELGDGLSNVSTDKRIKEFDSANDPQLVELYLQYGRYLLIASSRPGSQPANLQGIWNDSLTPPWESKWTVNINTEMNYWIAEMGNLSECHEPLFSMLEDVQETGTKVAREHYDADGWVLHHNTDIWRGAAPINASNHGIWMTGSGWLSQHFWLRYAFTQDEEFLRERAYPIMKEAAMFYEDFLIEDPRNNNWLISTPSNSPEIGGLVAGPSMDHQIIRNLLRNCVQASEILGVDKDLRKTWKSLIKKIAPNQIGQHGQLQEWLEDKDDPKNEHRHVSHLWALHPGNEISPLTTPELAEACKVTLSHRGDGGTGWSKAWKVNFWARLHDGNHSFKMFSELITKSTLPNMFDTHPPFQIDGNFGGSSGIMEMLLQSHMDMLHILPALPDALPSGIINGLVARGGFEVNLLWDNGELTKIEVLSKAGNKLKLLYGDKTKSINTKANETYIFDNDLKLMN